LLLLVLRKRLLNSNWLEIIYYESLLYDPNKNEGLNEGRKMKMARIGSP
jgi:hypothetical protein